jgi:hypothetical protein
MPRPCRRRCVPRLKKRDARIADLIGQLYDPDGTPLADENARLRDLVLTLNGQVQRAQTDNNGLRGSLHAARANVKRERERNVTHLFAGQSAPAQQ